MNIPEEKKKVRKEIKQLMANTSEDFRLHASSLVFEQIEQSLEFKKSKCVMLYWSFGNELPTHDTVINWYQIKKIVLPKIIGNNMVAAPFEGTDKMLNVPPFGIGEPDTLITILPQEIDLIIVPGIAFDTNGNRLGRGKAYYDRFLPQCRAFLMGVGYPFQLLTNVPHDTNDVKMNRIVIP